MQILNVGNYVIGEKIGEGNYAEVKLATHAVLKAQVALKIINLSALSQSDVQKIHREVKIMKVLQHPNIIRLYQVMQDRSERLYMVTEYASGGELYNHLVKCGCMEESDARSVFTQLLLALEFCHSHNVVHRDIKLENLLLDANGNVKLADFGFSNFYSWDGNLSTWCGSPSYAAPEIFEGREYIGPEVDIWSAGVVLYTLVSGCLPFDGANVQELKQRVIKGIFRIHFRISEDCQEIINKMLIYDPTKRFTIPKLRKQPWMEKSAKQVPVAVVREEGEPSKMREYVISNLKANGVDPCVVLEAAKERKYDDWYGMYSILEDNYFKELTTNGPPVLNAESRALPSVGFPELQQQSETLRQARDWTCGDLAKVPSSLSSRSSIGSSQMEQRIRTISEHDAQFALHQQYLNYRRHSLDIFTFPGQLNHHAANQPGISRTDLLPHPLHHHLKTEHLARRASDSIALQQQRVLEQPSIPHSLLYYQQICKKKEEEQQKFLSSVPSRLKTNPHHINANNPLGRRFSGGHLVFNKGGNNLGSLQELPGQEHDSEEMLPIPSSLQLPSRPPRRHSFEPSMLLSGASSKSALQQHLESLYEQAIVRGQTEEGESGDEKEESGGAQEEHDRMNAEEEYNAQYQYQRSQSIGSRLQGLQIHQANTSVEEWQKNSSEYMDCLYLNPSDQHVQPSSQTLHLPRQVSNVNLYSDQPPFTILGLVEKCFLKGFNPAPCLNQEGFAIRASWSELELCAEVCAIGCKNGVQLRYVRGDKSYYQAVSNELLTSLNTL